MASITMVQAADLCQDVLVSGVIETVVTIDPFYNILPFEGIDGNGLSYDREVAADETDGVVVQSGTVGTTITAKTPVTVTKVTSTLVKILGDAEVDNMVEATQSTINDQVQTQLKAKSKYIGRRFRNLLINGDGTSNTFEGLLNLCAAGQKVATGATGKNLDFDTLDELQLLVKSKEGVVDYMLMPGRTIKSLKALYRALGGAAVMEVMQMPNGMRVFVHEGIPIFRNDYIPINVTKGGQTNTTYVFAGCLDDGDHKTGLSGLTARNAFGIQVKDCGQMETKDETLYRLSWYCGLALFNELGLAMADGIRN